MYLSESPPFRLFAVPPYGRPVVPPHRCNTAPQYRRTSETPQGCNIVPQYRRTVAPPHRPGKKTSILLLRRNTLAAIFAAILNYTARALYRLTAAKQYNDGISVGYVCLYYCIFWLKNQGEKRKKRRKRTLFRFLINVIKRKLQIGNDVYTPLY